MLLAVLTWIAIGVATIVLAILIVPIRVSAEGCVDDREGIDYRLIIDWAWGIFSIQTTSPGEVGFYLIGLRICRIPLKMGTIKKIRKKSKKEKASPLKWLEWFRGNYARINDVLGKFARGAFIKGQLYGSIGLTDPADTATIGILGRLLQTRTRHFDLSLTTVYEYETIQIRAYLQSTLIIGYLGVIVLGLLLDNRIRMMLRGVPQTK